MTIDNFFIPDFQIISIIKFFSVHFRNKILSENFYGTSFLVNFYCKIYFSTVL